MKRRRPKGNVEKLKALLKERKAIQTQEKVDEQEIIDSVRDPQKVVVMKTEVSTESKNLSPIEVNKGEEAKEPLKENQDVPQWLRGLTIADLLLLDVDNGLSESERKWLRSKKFYYDRRLMSPSKDGWM